MARFIRATFDHVSRSPLPTVDISQMDRNQKDGFCVTTLDALDMFYSDPENLKRFMEWEKEYDRMVEVAI